MNREQQEKNTKVFYWVLLALAVFMLVSQLCIYIGYTLAEVLS